ncbi:hypothetical protein PM082_003391 [Marasmius tenuissimus]|nr:hypothetical protein PM082_003391 [Marasmius tenuissimus]
MPIPSTAMDPKKRPHSRSPSPAAKRATPANLLSRNRDSTSSSVSSSQNQRGLQEPGRMQGKRSRTNTSSFRGGSSSNSRRVTQSGCAKDVRDLGGVDPLRNELTVVKRRLEETEDELNQQNKNVMMLLREKAEAEKRHIKTVEDLERRIEALESQCKAQASRKTRTQTKEITRMIRTGKNQRRHVGSMKMRLSRQRTPPNELNTSGSQRKVHFSENREHWLMFPQNNRASTPTSPSDVIEPEVALKHARAEFDTIVVGRCPFSIAEKQLADVAAECWRKASSRCSLNIRTSTEVTIQQIVRRGNNIRTRLLSSAVRPSVRKTYGFDSCTTTRQDNVKTYGQLVNNNNFAYTDPEHLSGAFEVPIIEDILRAIFSISSIRQKIKQPDYRGDFNPVSLELMGFILTLIKFCICEWERGVHEREDFVMKKHLKDYNHFMTLLRRWNSCDSAHALRHLPLPSSTYCASSHERACTNLSTPLSTLPFSSSPAFVMFCSKAVFRCFKALERFGDRITGAAGPYFVGFAIILISTGTICFFDVVMPTLSYPLISGPICILIALNLFMHYYYVCTIPPGFVDEPPREPGNSLLWSKPRTFQNKRPLTEGVRWSSELNVTKASVTRCRKCGQLKPERTHHCRICNKCVLKYDHHCPCTLLDPVCSTLESSMSLTGINQCVGIHNERHFVMFMGYLCLAAFCFCVLGYPQFFEALGLFTDDWPYHVPVLAYILLFILAGVLFFAVGAMFLFHLYSVMKGETSVESQDHGVYRKVALSRAETFVNSYDLGRLRNLQLFFNVGENGYPIYTLFFPFRIMPYTDGRSWARRPGFDRHHGVRQGEELTDEEEEEWN